MYQETAAVGERHVKNYCTVGGGLRRTTDEEFKVEEVGGGFCRWIREDLLQKAGGHLGAPEGFRETGAVVRKARLTV